MVQKKKRAAAQNILVEGNLEIHPDFALLALNPALFPLPVVYAASSKFLKRAYVLIDGDPSEEIVIELRPKKKGVKLAGLGRELCNRLLGELEQYHQHTLPRLERFAGAFAAAGKSKEKKKQRSEDKMSYLDDPLGIMKPWEEKKR